MKPINYSLLNESSFNFHWQDHGDVYAIIQFCKQHLPWAIDGLDFVINIRLDPNLHFSQRRETQLILWVQTYVHSLTTVNQTCKGLWITFYLSKNLTIVNKYRTQNLTRENSRTTFINHKVKNVTQWHTPPYLLWKGPWEATM